MTDRERTRHLRLADARADEASCLDYLAECNDSDDPADHVRAASATRDLTAIRDWLDNLPDSDMDIRHVIG